MTRRGAGARLRARAPPPGVTAAPDPLTGDPGPLRVSHANGHDARHSVPRREPATAINQRAKILTDEHYDACGRMENWAAVRGIVVKALSAGHDDEAIRKALADLRGSGMSVVTATLRNALERPGSGGRGQPRSASGRTQWEPRSAAPTPSQGTGVFR
jgi:hypothetical protein